MTDDDKTTLGVFNSFLSETTTNHIMQKSKSFFFFSSQISGFSVSWGRFTYHYTGKYFYHSFSHFPIFKHNWSRSSWSLLHYYCTTTLLLIIKTVGICFCFVFFLHLFSVWVRFFLNLIVLTSVSSPCLPSEYLCTSILLSCLFIIFRRSLFLLCSTAEGVLIRVILKWVYMLMYNLFTSFSHCR